MSNAAQIDRNKCAFVSAPGMLSFPALFPGEAKDSQRPGSKSYKLELICDDPGQEMLNAVCYVAQFFDGSGINPATGQPMWHRHVYGRTGRLKRLEDYDRRDAAKYPYAVGKFVLGLSKTLTLKGLKMEGQNLADPAIRARYDQLVAAAAPKVSKYLNPHDPVDMMWINEENQRRAFANMPPLVDDAQIRATTRAIKPDEIWPGCMVRVSGRAYWDSNVHKTVLLALEQVLLVGTGERLVAAEPSPDQVFGSFAPAADLAPPSPFGAPITGLPLPAPQPVMFNPYGTPQPGYAMPTPVVQAPPAPPQRNPFEDFR